VTSGAFGSRVGTVTDRDARVGVGPGVRVEMGPVSTGWMGSPLPPPCTKGSTVGKGVAVDAGVQDERIKAENRRQMTV
jgi:hypothetical protein